VHADTQAKTWEEIGTAGPLESTRPLAHSVSDYWLTNPIARASETMAQCSREFGAANKMAAE
jgi:NADH-quinone oxidoreductase subunit G